jgi:hypothetical protein
VVEEMWRVVEPLIEAPPPVEVYEPGTGAGERRRPDPRAGRLEGPMAGVKRRRFTPWMMGVGV